MNKDQFILWLGGFVDAVGEKGPTPKQWETIVSELNQVKEPISFPIYPKQPNTGPVPLPNVTFPYGAPIPVTCEGTSTINGNFGALTNGNTTTTTLPKGTNVSYTANLPEQEDKLKANGYVD